MTIRTRSAATTRRPNTTRSGTPGRWAGWTGRTSPTRSVGTWARRCAACRGPALSHRATWDELRAGARSTAWAPEPVSAASLGDFFYHSLALSAWKQVTGPDGAVVSRWALRVNPSSGNLHPTEAWLIDSQGVHHYAPDIHALELRGAVGR